MTILFTADARYALLEVGDYSRAQHGERGERYLDELHETLRRLQLLPHQGQVVREGVMRIRHERHVIFYRPDAGGDVLVLDILHEKQFPPSHLR
jgi:plasmid stabilization system protein ParE